jgi:ATP-binding cassette subfamily F protein uup
VSPPLIQLTDIGLTFGGAALLDGVDMSISAGERACLVGRNGSGKSTLLKIVAGLVEPDRGTRFLQPGATMRYLPQEPDLSGFASVEAYVEAGLGPSDPTYQVRYLIEQLGLRGDENPAQLSGGEARRAALARVLAPSPDIILLDEPTNHLDLEVIEWLEGELSGRNSALIIISHDRRFLSNLSNSTIWIDRGKARSIPRGFSEFETWRDDVLAEEEREQHKLGRKIVAEEHWLRHGVSGRRKRNVRRLGNLLDLRQQRRDYRGVAGKATVTAADAAQSGVLVIEAKEIAKAFGSTHVVSGFSTRIARGDRIGIVGPNGAGKTTLVKMLTGVLEPDSGTVRLGANVVVATLEQDRNSLNPNDSVSDTLTGGRGDSVTVAGKSRHVVGYLKDFLFTPEQVRTPVAALSGGERARLMLARLLTRPSNLLVLDEPTNDLDLETLDVLEEMIGDYEGTVLLISHDRDFLDRTVNAVIAPERDGRWTEYAGGYGDMLAQRGADLSRRASRTAAPGGAAREPSEGPSNSARKRKLSFNDKHALDTLPGTIAALQTKIADLDRKLADPQLYVRDRKTFDAASAAMAAAQAELAVAEDRWLELELLREDIEST